MGQSRVSKDSRKLKDNHPFAQKIRDLYDYLESNGITITHEYYGLIFSDDNSDLSVDVLDIEDSSGMDSFPSTEYKLLINE